jgi:hypothetical protein
MADKNTVVAIHLSHSEDLQEQSGFEVRKLSIVAEDYHTEENIVGYYSAGDRATCCAPAGHPGASCVDHHVDAAFRDPSRN